MKIPGIVWTLLTYALPLLAGWVIEFYGHVDGALAIAGLIAIAGNVIAKGVEVQKPPVVTGSVNEASFSASNAPLGASVYPTKTDRFLWG